VSSDCRAVTRTAKHGIQGMVGGGSAEGGAMHRVVLDWQTALASDVVIFVRSVGMCLADVADALLLQCGLPEQSVG
jgi:hypothetical protein